MSWLTQQTVFSKSLLWPFSLDPAVFWLFSTPMPIFQQPPKTVGVETVSLILYTDKSTSLLKLDWGSKVFCLCDCFGHCQKLAWIPFTKEVPHSLRCFDALLICFKSYWSPDLVSNVKSSRTFVEFLSLFTAEISHVPLTWRVSCHCGKIDSTSVLPVTYRRWLSCCSQTTIQLLVGSVWLYISSTE